MKSSTQIIGLPIISIQNGSQVGKVNSLVINPEKGSVDFLVVEQEDWQISVKAIPFRKIVGIGEFAVTIEEESAIIDLNVIPIANELVNKKIAIKNAKVMTRKGELLGEAIEFFIDEETGMILGLQLHVGDRETILPAKQVLTYGKDIIIVREEAPSSFADDVNELNQLEKSNEAAEKESQSSAMLAGEQPIVENDQKSNVVDDQEDYEIQMLKRKQIELLTGKKVKKDIMDRNGNVFIPAGTVLTAEDVMRAQEEGPGVIVELSMHVEEE
ncbi:PRC-barrel domain-containing protein [Thermolongibacillus altinsuensis]|jgi:uncharacterized protein YrrD|uniref:PRC-barrel domain-containing protein n=1 Tax=Thermolongibacillus altinsuensis TaxID=575256 RepID=UPI00242A2F69|nr:PRC-barrel domain-containing protein [Thermolongibacillus altinsuensis]GMB07459.1 photosystem reaction center subunit H [Thermolongibacillus altinsuensis]